MRKTIIAATLAVATATVAATIAWAQGAVDVAVLYKEFQDNEPGFNQRYKGKTLAVSGLAWNMVGAGDSSFVGVAAEGGIGQLLLCHTTPAAMANLKKNERRVFTGVITQANSSGIHMQPCNF